MPQVSAGFKRPGLLALFVLRIRLPVKSSICAIAMLRRNLPKDGLRVSPAIFVDSASAVSVGIVSLVAVIQRLTQVSHACEDDRLKAERRGRKS